MSDEAAEGGPYETSRRDLASRTPDELAELIFERFEDAYPSDGLYAGTLRDRVWQFVLNRVQAICGQASDLGTQVWEALHDDRTAHSVERFALVCGFFASKVFPGGHWPAHEVAALVLLIISTRPKAGSPS